MYSPPSSQRRQAIKQAVIYLFMVLAVVFIVAALILVTLGYRFDRTDRTIVQGGLIQFDSTPSGATVNLNSVRLSGRTRTRTAVSPGEHLVTMTRDGYRPWQKSVEVGSGRVLWLNYARLIPNDLTVENVASLPGVTSSLASPNRRLIAMTTEATSPEITLVDISSDTPKVSTLELPDSIYSQTESDSPNERFRVEQWDKDSRYLLVEHRYDRKVEWIVVDTEDVSASSSLSSILDAPMTNVQFSQRDGKTLYAIVEGDIRRLDTEEATISAPIVRGIKEFSLFNGSIIVYSTLPDSDNKSRSVGYIHDGASEPRTIRSFQGDTSTPLHVAVGKYYSTTYVAIAHGESVEILEGSLPRSDSDDTLALEGYAVLTAPESIDYLTSRLSGRFFVAQHGNSFITHDIELDKTTTTNLRGESPVKGRLGWLDDYRVWTSLDDVLRIYEFDGANQHDIMPIVSGQSPALTPNGRFLYAPTKNDSGDYHLSRVRLILP